MLATDAASVAAAFGLTYLAGFARTHEFLDYAAVISVAPILTVITLGMYDAYAVHRVTPIEEFRRVISAVATSVALLTLIFFWSKSHLARSWIAAAWLASVGLVLISRRLWHVRLGKKRMEGELVFRTLIVGTNEEGAHLSELFNRFKRIGLLPVGFVRTGRDPSDGASPDVAGGWALGQVREAIRETGAECVFIASTALSPEQLRDVARAARVEGAEVKVSVSLPETLSTKITAQPVGGVMALSLRPVRLSGYQSAAKRSMDLALSGLGLLVTAPLFAGIAVAIKLTSHGTVFYRQNRVGHLGEPFRMLKFRTMVKDADARMPEMHQHNESDGPLFKMRDDPRVTSVGRFLRRWSLDELPQLVNVLMGRMSLIGPRPSLPAEVSRYEDWHRDRLEVRPGITGLWQVSGRSTLSFDDYVRLDLFYIENWSLWYDLFILAKTVPAVLTGRGSY